MVTLQRIPSHRSLGARAEAAIGDSADGGDAVRQGRHVTTRANQFTAQGSFTDQCTSFDGARWVRADGWANGSPFDNGWRADHATVAGGLVDLRLDDVSSSGQPYTSGEVRTSGYYGYGCYEASFKPVRQSGVVSAFFTFAGPYDNGGNGRHNEIDVEFLGYDT